MNTQPPGFGRPPKAPPPADAFADPRLWRPFLGARDPADLLAAWLALLHATLPGAEAAVLFMEPARGEGFRPVARTGAKAAKIEALQAVAETALGTGGSEVTRAAGRVLLAYPVDAGGARAVVAVAATEPPGSDAAPLWRRLHWAAGWLRAVLREREAQAAQGFAQRAAFALDMLAVANEHEKLEACALAVVNALHGRFDCSHAAIGLLGSGGTGARLRLTAISRTASVRRRARLVGALENAMGEAVDQAAPVAVPEGPDDPAARITVAHRAYLAEAGIGAAVSVPLLGAEGPVGALTLERRGTEAFSAEEIETAEALGAMLGGLLVLKQRQRRWVSGRLADGLRDGLSAVFGPRRLSWKLVAASAALALLVVTLVPADLRVSGDAVLEGETQRAAAAPFDGFIAAAPARAGDRVAAGDVLARLDDADLRLEVQRWRAEHAQLMAERRVALAGFDRAEAGLLQARIAQAAAQRDLAEARLARTAITAPIEGVVIAGDLSQRIGGPVRQGEALYEIAPLDAYRVAVRLVERDMALVETGQPGSLLLAGRTEARLPITVTAVTSVAETAEGQTLFRIEARLDEDLAGVRPGMEGVAKITTGRAALVTVWTRTLRHWLQVTLWRWTP
jgi:multidrug resistance efflux pump